MKIITLFIEEKAMVWGQRLFKNAQMIGKGLVAIWSVLAMIGCATMADLTAPPKEAKQPESRALAQLETEFWQVFHVGQYDKIPDLIARYQAIYIENPTYAKAAVRLGFLHVWRLSEWTRRGVTPPSHIDHATLCKTYFAEASAMIPGDARLAGFHAACIMAEADIHKNEKNLRKGYFAMLDAVNAWPEFNGFTAGYVLSNLPYNNERFDEGVEFQWQVVDECAGERVDRNQLDYRKFAALEVKNGPKRVCWNSRIAPHNFEGFFLNMGDMLVKQGKVAQAKMIYRQATYSKDYPKWPFRKVLEQRLAQADQLVEPFRRPVVPPQKPTWPVIMFHSAYSCGGCHRSK
jgi:hypothetical protein